MSSSGCLFDFVKLNDVSKNVISRMTAEEVYTKVLAWSEKYDKELYEYERPVHTLDAFTEKQYEVKTSEELINVLNKIKEIDINSRFSNLREQKTDCCKKIAEEILR